MHIQKLVGTHYTRFGIYKSDTNNENDIKKHPNTQKTDVL